MAIWMQRTAGAEREQKQQDLLIEVVYGDYSGGITQFKSRTKLQNTMETKKLD